MKVLVTGTAGQVARSLKEKAAAFPQLSLAFAGRPELDLENEETIRRCVAAERPDVIVSAAAYTAVDKAEAEEATARAVNGAAPGILASEARALGARLIHLSTDYVFDGGGTAAFREDAPTAPINAYGRTKLAGEEAVRHALPDHLILRTAWVYSPFGRNFVKTMLELARTRDELRVVADQVGNPTSALDIADAVLAVIDRWRTGPRLGLGATYHFGAGGEASWADLAQHVLQVSAALGGPTARVVGIATEEWPTPAARPRNSRLDSSAFAREFGISARHWQDSVSDVVERLIRSPT